MSEHERFLEETRFVLIAEGDGAEIRIANAGDIHDELHRLMCYCRQPWRECCTEGIKAEIVQIYNPDNWASYNGRPFSIKWNHEDGKVLVYRIDTEA